jgi:hypothetical protein
MDHSTGLAGVMESGAGKKGVHMRLRIVRALAVLVASAAALVVGAAPAHADSVTTVGYYTDNLDHGGNAALGRVKFEA